MPLGVRFELAPNIDLFLRSFHRLRRRDDRQALQV